MKRWTVSLAIAFILFLFHSPVFSKSIVDTDTQEPASSKIVSGLDAKWQATPSPFTQQPGGFTLKIGNGRHGSIVFPAVLDAHNPIIIQIQKNKVQQVLASGGTYKAELVGKYLVYRGEKNSILYRYDADKQSLREFVYLKEASALAKSGDVIQWRFEGADLKLKNDGSVALTQTIDIKNEVRKVSNNHMADRISRFLAKKRSTPEKPGSQTRTLFTIPKPEYIDGHGKTLTQGIQYKVADTKLTLHLDPNAKLAYPLWVDPTLQFLADNDADVIIDGPSRFTIFGLSVATAGDFNGDGYDDVIIGGFNFEKAVIFFGQNPVGQINLRADADADVIINGLSQATKFGRTVGSTGDFNGDGLDDVVVGAYRDNNSSGLLSGRAFIYFGRTTSTQLTLEAELDANIILEGINSFESFGETVAPAGDFNGDGLDDIIFGSSQGMGKAYIFFGRNVTNQILLKAAFNADVTLQGQNSNGFFGTSVATAKDFNGDGFDDVVVGAPGVTHSGLFRSGSAYIFFGQNYTSPITLTDEGDADVIFEHPTSIGFTAGDFFGGSVGGGDFNNDGFSDVIVGAWQDDNNGEGNSGSAFIFFGRNSVTQLRLTADANSDVIINGQNSGDNLGKAASVGDFNGDGFDDFIVGAPGDNERIVNGAGYGKSFIFYGNNTSGQITLRSHQDADVIFMAQNNGDFSQVESFGAVVASAGDFNGDGVPEVLIGAPYNDNNAEPDSGSAYLFLGQDITPPTITILGDNPTTTEGGLSYTDAGATATDIVDGDLTSSIVVGGLPINTSVAGTHTVTYNVSDSSGNAAAQVTRTVNVTAPAPPVTLSVINVFDNKNGKNYFPGGPDGTDPLDDINSLAQEDKVEVLGDGSSFWWEAQYADPDPALGNPSQVLVTVNYRPEDDWTGTFTVQYRVGSTVLASTTLPGNSSGNAKTFTWDLSSVVTTSSDLANGRVRFLNSDPSNGKKVFVSFSSTTATLGN